MDTLTTKMLQTEEHLRKERVRNRMMDDKLKQMELDVEAIPILKAQVHIFTLVQIRIICCVRACVYARFLYENHQNVVRLLNWYQTWWGAQGDSQNFLHCSVKRL